MTILLIFSTILLKTINFLVICYLLAKTSMLNKIKSFSGFTKVLEQRFTGKNGYNCLLPHPQTVKKIVAD